MRKSTVETVNACFRPSADDVVWARRVLEAAAAAKGAAVAVDGKMVDLPVIRKAQEVIAAVEFEARSSDK